LTLLAKGFALRKELIDSGPHGRARTGTARCAVWQWFLRPEATLNLRVIAGRLQAVISVGGRTVLLLPSSAIALRELGGVPAQIPKPALDAG
jgi:hypothetical protein